MKALRSVLVAAAAIVSVAGLAAPASAHPSDEFLLATYVTPGANVVSVEVDITPGVLIAPAFAKSLDLDGDGALDPDEVATHLTVLTSSFTLIVDDVPTAMTLVSNSYAPLDLIAAGGGSIEVRLTAPAPGGGPHSVRLDNRYDPGRSTIQSSAIVPNDASATVGAISRSPDGRSITVAFAGSVAALPRSVEAPSSSGPWLLEQLRRPLGSPWALMAILALSAVLGALHALTPGHGKTMLAAYLVGSRGTPRQAVLLASMVTVTHTTSVIVIGLGALAAGQLFVPSVVVPLVEAIAGLLVAVIGIRLIMRWRTGTADHGHGHEHHHEHEHNLHHEQHHGHIHEHDDRVVGGSRGLVAMGAAGGVVPCPEALGVLLLAISVHRAALGVAMIVAFSVGLAAVLVAIGLLLVRTRSPLTRLAARTGLWQRRLPMVSAVVVTVLGVAMLARGVDALAH
jgi:ABC-type nickel/cobalt efflux system permease component RcnA